MAHEHIARLNERLRKSAAANADLDDALVKEMRAFGASDDAIVRKLAELISDPPTLGDAILRSLANPVVPGATVVVKEGQPLDTLSSGARVLDPGAVLDGLSAAQRLRKGSDDRAEETRENLDAARRGGIAVRGLEKARAKREARGKLGARPWQP